MHKEKSLIEIRTSTLSEGINRLDFTCQARDFEGRRLAEAGFTGAITVTVIAKKSDDEIAVTINTSAVADSACDRCLAPIAKVLTGTLDLFYTFGLKGNMTRMTSIVILRRVPNILTLPKMFATR